MKAKKKQTIIIVGGGVTGLFGAILLSEIFDRIYIIEKEPTCGGLLRSVIDNAGVVYDIGSHVPTETQIAEIDKILFKHKEKLIDNWSELQDIKQGNYFNQQWNYQNAHIDTRFVEKKLYDKGVKELLALTKESNKTDIKSYLYDTIGPTFSNNIILPVINKIYDRDGSSLSLEAANWPGPEKRGLKNIIALTAELTNKLKNNKIYDLKLAHHGHNEKTHKYYYPVKNIGMTSWIRFLVDKAEKCGVKILNNDYIRDIYHVDGQINSVKLGRNKQTINCNYILWTCPVGAIIKAAKLPPMEDTSINYRSSNVLHFSYNKPLLNQTNTHLWNWDTNYSGLRYTLYPNLQREIKPALNNITVEVVSDYDGMKYITTNKIDEELREIGLVCKNARIITSMKQVIHNTFPIPEIRYKEKVKKELDYITNSLHNLLITGQSSAKTWFQNEIITDAYYTIKNRFNYD